VADRPWQIVLVLPALGAIILAVKPSRVSGKVIAVILAFLWLWAGAIYHLLFFSRINTLAPHFAALFIVQAILFLYEGVAANRLSFGAKWDLRGMCGALLVIFALIIYPVIGHNLGQIYPAQPTFGAPCPTTIFTFGLLLWTNKKVPFYLLIIPFLWSLVGISAAVTMGVKEDFGLPLAAMIGTGLILYRDHARART
jgi:hypothetical protein